MINSTLFFLSLSLFFSAFLSLSGLLAVPLRRQPARAVRPRFACDTSCCYAASLKYLNSPLALFPLGLLGFSGFWVLVL